MPLVSGLFRSIFTSDENICTENLSPMEEAWGPHTQPCTKAAIELQSSGLLSPQSLQIPIGLNIFSSNGCFAWGIRCLGPSFCF